MKTKYFNIEIEIIFLENEDIVTASVVDDPFKVWE